MIEDGGMLHVEAGGGWVRAVLHQPLRGRRLKGS